MAICVSQPSVAGKIKQQINGAFIAVKNNEKRQLFPVAIWCWIHAEIVCCHQSNPVISRYSPAHGNKHTAECGGVFRGMGSDTHASNSPAHEADHAIKSLGMFGGQSAAVSRALFPAKGAN